MKDLGQADKVRVGVKTGGCFFGGTTLVRGGKLAVIKQTAGHQLGIEFAEQLAQGQAGGAAVVVCNSLRRPLERISHYVGYHKRSRLAQSIQPKPTLKIVLPE